MHVLGIESTCDETAAAVVVDGRTILSNVIASQADLHERYGGVVPELASRRHIESIVPVVDAAIDNAGISKEHIDLVAVANAPGLIGALLVGVNFAKSLSFALGKPLIGVNHIEAHLYACVMSSKVAIPFPVLGAVLSGGHTSLVKMDDVGNYTLIAQTVDDAIGEAFDKCARILGLPYPGGPQIERLALNGDPSRFPLRAGNVKGRPHDYSFSGLKTAVLYTAKGVGCQKDSPLKISESQLPDLAAAFQEAALNDVVDKMTSAARHHGCRAILIGGGVSHNKRLRALLEEKCPLPTFWPAPGLSLDNAAMIAGLGFHRFQQQGTGDSLELPVLTRSNFIS